MIFSLRRLSWSLVVSMVFHASLLMLAPAQHTKRPAPRIEVRLPQPAESFAQALLKNTLPDEGVGRPEPKAQSAASGRRAARDQARQRLAEHVFYPPRAVAQGIEGEVRLLLKLDPAGRLIAARIASSSGHEILDRAALAAAYAAGSFPAPARELILPVVFRLSE